MKQFFLLGIALTILFSCKSKTHSFTSETTFGGEFVFDFGEAIEGEIVKARFELTNTGKEHLSIISVKPACGCTVADYSKEPIPPGKNGWVEASVDTDGRPGDLEKSVTVMANTIPTATVLVVKGKVIPKNK
jgi:hypothetical protein